MWKKEIILILCIFYVRTSLANTYRETSSNYNHRIRSRRQLFNREKSTLTTSRTILQKYLHSFVRNFPTLTPLSWNITNPISNIFKTRVQQMIETPVATQYVREMPNKRKTKTSKQKSLKKSKNRKSSQTQNYINSYNNNNQQTEFQLQPVGLDYNGVMNFYEHSSRQYYTLQLELQPFYYHKQYVNQNNDQQYEGEYDDNENYSRSISDKSHNDDYTHQQSYDSEDHYNSHHEYGIEDNDYDRQHIQYELHEYEPKDVENMEYDDDIELKNNWGYNDEEIFADRQLKGGSINFDDNGILKVRKHLLRKKLKDEVKLSLSEAEKPSDQKEKSSKENEPERKEMESANNIIDTSKEISTTKKIQTVTEKPKERIEHFVFSPNVFASF